MPKVRILVVDKTRAAFLRDGIDFYCERISRYLPLEWVEVKPARMGPSSSVSKVLSQEAKGISARLSAQDANVALDRKGKALDSVSFARWFEDLLAQGRQITFVVGGAYGLAPEILRQTDAVLSLSRLTMTHEMVRVVFLEQLYRAMTIIRGEKYHH
ncbi:MAG: 23S rRNA (pseudouridine(1915)-N(3))-methyltransferase RlmH [Deltaproteobacteria bacterium]|nr:23S rRNA (pseudouridine(1915)-N(3))-methyltransferase RlmH [Deltaproteobacteria bacterium]MBW1921940.1 23S rRNA (pseudouridine(1915)-N(3))-methyltransferase RlmH [Deltaproteobacteria bacterium]MBW1948792.1 23S rRNA (pseudouridine(1915)-N(3))-methyltransferase RlmH [Deltaproteobacteria bacterium]MBW2006469.1 23S rRNA (pseudouridine(1915)-N(3))-methyltransferase RlmH [Deltaproteobacteria bacterium]MBW2101165.1 23S rRNA (pseudouridine(1915)-N(3))-methyltransferase RlmH [Deltaproteobacteria bact